MHLKLGFGAALGAQALALALPQEESPSTTAPPSPTAANCSINGDHWDCPGKCTISVVTRLGIETSVTNYAEWLTSMNLHWSTSGVPWSGENVYVHSSLYTFAGGSFSGYGIYDSDALTRAGYNIITQTVTESECETITVTSSPSQSGCSPHGDHWHCPTETTTSEAWETSCSSPEPATESASAASVTGSASATDPAAASATTSSSAEELCDWHIDHYHCPPGVPEPTGPPATAVADTDSATAIVDESSGCSWENAAWVCAAGVSAPTTQPTHAATASPTEDSGDSEDSATGMPAIVPGAALGSRLAFGGVVPLIAALAALSLM